MPILLLEHYISLGCMWGRNGQTSGHMDTLRPAGTTPFITIINFWLGRVVRWPLSYFMCTLTAAELITAENNSLQSDSLLWAICSRNAKELAWRVYTCSKQNALKQDAISHRETTAPTQWHRTPLSCLSNENIRYNESFDSKKIRLVGWFH